MHMMYYRYNDNDLLIKHRFLAEADKSDIDSQADNADILDPKTMKYKDEVYCTYCFEAVSERLQRPLDWKQFDLMKEWYLEVLLDLDQNVYLSELSCLSKEWCNSPSCTHF
jgi:hypothetical protein